MKLKPLQVFENTWYKNLDGGKIILLSKDDDYWTIAFSYKKLGAQILKFTDEEILKCEYLGNIKDFSAPKKIILDNNDYNNKYIIKMTGKKIYYFVHRRISDYTWRTEYKNKAKMFDNINEADELIKILIKRYKSHNMNVKVELEEISNKKFNRFQIMDI